jgi:hypothetical protein
VGDVITFGDLAGAQVSKSVLDEMLQILTDEDGFSRMMGEVRMDGWARERWQSRAIANGNGYCSHVVDLDTYMRRRQKDQGQDPRHAVDPEWWDWVGRKMPQTRTKYVPDKVIVAVPEIKRRVVKRYPALSTNERQP